MKSNNNERLVFIGRDGKEVVGGLNSARKAASKPSKQKSGGQRPSKPVSAGRHDRVASESPGIVFIDKSGKDIVGLMGTARPKTAKRTGTQKKRSETTRKPVLNVSSDLIYVTASGKELVGGYRKSTLEYQPPEPGRLEKIHNRLCKRRDYRAALRVGTLAITAPGVYIVTLSVAGFLFIHLRQREMEMLQEIKEEKLTEIASHNVHAEASAYALNHLSPIHVTLETAKLSHVEIMAKYEQGEDVYEEYFNGYQARYKQLSERYRAQFEKFSKLPVSDFRQNF